MIRHTGGTAVAATSTRSRLRWVAISRARVSGTTFCVPSTSISRTSRARICWLIRTLGVGIGREIRHLLRCRLGTGLRSFLAYARGERLDRHRRELLAAAGAGRDLLLLGLAITDDEH